MKIALIGYGKMGRAIDEVATAKGHEVVLRISTLNQHELTIPNLQKADVAIEFTNPSSAVANITKCFEAGVPVVCGTTGWNEMLAEVKDQCSKHSSALVYASNFSIGVNLFFELNQKLAKLMKDYSQYNVTIEETHHTAKKDAPSGTAITLAEQIIAAGKKEKWVKETATASNELAILSHRIDPAPGTHKVAYTSQVDDIEIIHTAHNRLGFAGGAVLAAEFIVGKKGVYGMKEVLNLQSIQ
jgi:4-hydroxy-tetrahydrodipicolinate reductase